MINFDPPPPSESSKKKKNRHSNSFVDIHVDGDHYREIDLIHLQSMNEVDQSFDCHVHPYLRKGWWLQNPNNFHMQRLQHTSS